MNATTFSLKRLAFGLSAAAVLLGGCDSDDSHGIDTALQGLYRIDTWTENTQSCAQEGPSVLSSHGETKLAVSVQSFFVPFIVALTCVDAQECANRSASLFGGAILSEGSDAAGWTGKMAMGGPPEGNTCKATVIKQFLTSPSQGKVRLETRTIPVTFSVRQDSGECEIEDAFVPAESAPCTELEVITASYESALPPAQSSGN